MAVKPMTAKQRYWLEHVTAADASDGTLSEYAAEQDLPLKSLYGWKTKLIRRGYTHRNVPTALPQLKRLISLLVRQCRRQNNPAAESHCHPGPGLSLWGACDDSLDSDSGGPCTMIRPSSDARIYLYRQPVDLRKAINPKFRSQANTCHRFSGIVFGSIYDFRSDILPVSAVRWP